MRNRDTDEIPSGFDSILLGQLKDGLSCRLQPLQIFAICMLKSWTWFEHVFAADQALGSLEEAEANRELQMGDLKVCVVQSLCYHEPGLVIFFFFSAFLLGELPEDHTTSRDRHTVLPNAACAKFTLWLLTCSWRMLIDKQSQRVEARNSN